MTIRSMLKDKVQVRRYTKAFSDAHVVKAWATHITSLPCSIQRFKGDEVESYATEVSNKMYKIYCTPTDNNGDQRDIEASDKIIGLGRYAGRIFDVKAVFNEHNTVMRIEVEEKAGMGTL